MTSNAAQGIMDEDDDEAEPDEYSKFLDEPLSLILPGATLAERI